MLHIHNICIARSNLVSLRNLDAHLMDQVQVIDEDIFHGGLVHSITHLPLLFFFVRQGMNFVHPFLPFQGGVAPFGNHIS